MIEAVQGVNATIEPQRGAKIMFSDIREIHSVSSREWEAHLNLLSTKERNNVLKYRFDDDRRRALVSLLLQKSMVRSQIGVENNTGFEIRRTSEVSEHQAFLFLW